MAGTAASSSSTASSAASHPKRYDVFVSFRGEDTRSNFTSHLRDALIRKNIIAYLDDKLHRGNEISTALLKAIEQSHISLIIFSENYASSKWCLDELVKTLQCKEDQGQIVIPVFYKIDPSHVRKQSGSYEKAFAKHERDSKYDQDRLKKWKAALVKAANLAGWDSQIYGDESKLIHEIVKDVLGKLDYKNQPRELKGLFGINENLAPIESLIREFQTIGIWGMGGIGKTTIAGWLFDKYFSQYEGSCFLANVREKSGKHGQELHGLRNQLLSKLLGEDGLHMSTTNIESTFVMSRLRRRRVLIVLDDVSTSLQIEYLVGEIECFESGSRIIITTRDKHVLTKGVDVIHKVEELNFQESSQLFSLNAFNRYHPTMGYEELSKRAVDYAKGIPLALKVLGSFLHSKSGNEWESALTKLKRIPNEEIQSVLRLSYDGLNYEERETFLDIACFLKGEHKERVISLLDSYGFYASTGLRTLQDKALISIENNFVWMHDLIQAMGREIVRQESYKEPGRRSRLWDPMEVYDVLKYNKGTSAVEGIILDMSQIRDLHLSVDTFRKMTNLRFLKIYSSMGVRYSSVHIPTGLQLFSNELRFLKWNGYLSKSLPLSFCPEKLVELLLPNSYVKKLWDGVQDLVNLKRINLSGSRWLMELPDFSLASNLEHVDLFDCESLCYLHPSILSLHKLVTLNLGKCTKLKSLKSEIHFRSLRYLNLYRCSSLKEFSMSSEKIKRLELDCTRIKMLHSSIGRLSKLESLRLKGLRLENLPSEIYCLRNLKKLNLLKCTGQMVHRQKLHILFDSLQSLQVLMLDKCSDLSELPDNISILSSLRQLNLCGSNIEFLPASIKQLTGLKLLLLSYCKRLRSLPELPPSITYLNVNHCTSLETVSTFRLSLKGMSERILGHNCMKLDEHSLYTIMEYAHFSIKKNAREFVLRGSRAAYMFYICLPGSRVPEWFKYNRTTEASITIELAPPSNVLGFVFCVVVSPLPLNEDRYIFTQIQCYSEDGEKLDRGLLPWNNAFEPKMDFDHVYLWYDPVYCYNMLDGVKESRGNDQWTTCSTKISFKFIVIACKDRNMCKKRPIDRSISIKECAVYPMYASEHYNFINQMELESEFSDMMKRSKETQDGLEASEVGLGISRSH